jgi:hypothetical protein
MKLLLTSIGKTGNGRLGIIRQVGSIFLSDFGVVAHLLNSSAQNFCQNSDYESA